MSGLLAYGVYLPVLRLARERILAAHGWFNPGLAGLAQGERTICNWDEDAITMAVEAARAVQRAQPTAAGHFLCEMRLASTSLPIADREGAAIVAEAGGLGSSMTPLAVTGSPRAGLASLVSLLAGPTPRPTICIASDARPSLPASAQEMQNGAGAVALVVGEGEAIARPLAVHSVTTDFVDVARPQGTRPGTAWEERWVRDEGYLRIVPAAVNETLARLSLQPGDIHHFAIPAPSPGVAAALARAIGTGIERMVDGHLQSCGDLGTAQPLLMLADALGRAAPGERILVAAFGSGCDVLVLEATPALARRRAQFQGVAAALAHRHPEANYLRHLVGTGQLEIDRGRRAAAARASAHSVAWRERETVLGFVGGRCTRCGTVQFPRSLRCVASGCHSADPMDPVRFADREGRVLTCTADHLAYSPRPPVHYGFVDFEGGGRVLLEMADVEAHPVAPGARVRMVFRLRGNPAAGGPRSYFWKAIGMQA